MGWQRPDPSQDPTQTTPNMGSAGGRPLPKASHPHLKVQGPAPGLTKADSSPAGSAEISAWLRLEFEEEEGLRNPRLNSV